MLVNTEKATQPKNPIIPLAPSYCRFCKTELETTFVDLGMSPLCNAIINPSGLSLMEAFYPLHTHVCTECFLVQLEEFVTPSDIFGEYSYFSSFSSSWLAHAKKYAENMTDRFGLNQQSLVVEVASNDGYLLQNFVAAHIPVLGIDPARNVAQVAIDKGIRTETRFFGKETATEMVRKYGTADLLLGNNVLAHVPDINDFVSGLKIMLGPEGVITMEFPHLQRLVEENQFDTIYHEHFSYLSFSVVNRIFNHFGLELFDVEELPTHGGSLRIYACHAENTQQERYASVKELLDREENLGMNTIAYYKDFQEKVKYTKNKLLSFLLQAQTDGKTVVGYGAPGKGNTLLNYCGVKRDLIQYTVDLNPYKQGQYLPGSRIPILSPDIISRTHPDYVVILPWNLRDEIVEQLEYIGEWGGKFVIPIPELVIIDPKNP